MTEPRKVEETERSVCCSSELLSAQAKGKDGPQPDRDSMGGDRGSPMNKSMGKLEAPSTKSRGSRPGS